MLVIYLLMLQMVVLVIELLLARKLSLVFLRDLYRSCHLTASLIFGYKKNRATTYINGKAMVHDDSQSNLCN